MIKQEEVLQKEKIINACRGDGYMEAVRLVSQQEAKGRLQSLNRYVLDENCSLGKHFYLAESALLYCVFGSGHMDSNGEKTIFQAGDAAVFKSGEYYSLRNAEHHEYEQKGRQPLVFVEAIVRDENTSTNDAKPMIGICPGK
ncbi:MAG: hypothetical protein ACOYJB_07905 [Christensenellaceae bacterium]